MPVKFRTLNDISVNVDEKAIVKAYLEEDINAAKNKAAEKVTKKLGIKTDSEDRKEIKNQIKEKQENCLTSYLIKTKAYWAFMLTTKPAGLVATNFFKLDKLYRSESRLTKARKAQKWIE